MKIFSKTDEYTIYQGDCIPAMHKLADEGHKFDFSIFSPPFASLYSYSDDVSDMGNSKDSDDEFLLHYSFFANALKRVIKPGRLVCVHLQQVVRTKSNYGHMGLFDIRGHINRLMIDAGFNLYGEVTIPKNPQAQSIRTKSHQLQFSQWEKDSSVSRPALADWLQIFKMPGDNEIPVKPLESGLTRDIWIDWADMVWKPMEKQVSFPYDVWFDINETRVLNNLSTTKSTIGEGHKTPNTKFNGDERHMCPLQLDVIERAVLLWTNKGETVFTPFGGIASEGIGSVIHDRKAVIVELNGNYCAEGDRNMKGLLAKKNHSKKILTIFDTI